MRFLLSLLLLCALAFPASAQFVDRAIGGAAGSVVGSAPYTVTGDDIGTRSSSDAGYGLFQPTTSATEFIWDVESLTANEDGIFGLASGCVRASTAANAAMVCMEVLTSNASASTGLRLARMTTRATTGAQSQTVDGLEIVSLPTRFRLLQVGDDWTASIDDDFNGTFETTVGTATLASIAEIGVLVARGRQGSGSAVAVVDFELAPTTCESPTYVVATYDDLRNQPSRAGESAEVTTAGIAGCFTWVSSDVNGTGDDGGITINDGDGSSTTGFFLREFEYDEDNPIELDWYALSDEDDINGIVNGLAAAYSPDLFVRFPTSPMTLTATQWDFTCDGHAIERLRLLESDAAVTVQFPEATGGRIHTGARSGGCTSQVMTDFVIGTTEDKDDRDAYNLTFDGSSTMPVAGSPNGKGGSIFMHRSVVGDLDMTIRANCQNARSRCYNIVATGVDSVTVSGRVDNAGAFFSQVRTVVFDDTLYYGDPLAKHWGYTGVIDDGVAISDYNTFGSHDAALSFTDVDNIAGVAEMEYGMPKWALHFHDNVGSEAAPFTLISKEVGFLPTGEWLSDAGVVQEWGKTDAMQKNNNTDGDFFIKYIFHQPAAGDYRTSGPPPTGTGSFNWSLAFESTNNACAGQPTGNHDPWHNDNITVTLVNLRTAFFGNRVGCFDPMGTSDNITWKGDGVNPAMQVETLFLGTNNTVTGSQWSNIRAHAGPVQYAPAGTTAPCHGNTITGAETRNIIIDETCTGTTITNVTGLASREIQASESFTLTGVGTIPAGTYRFDSATLQGTDNGDGTFTIGGLI